MIVEWVIGFAVVSFVIVALVSITGFARGAIGPGPRADSARIAQLERELGIAGAGPVNPADHILKEVWSNEPGAVIGFEEGKGVATPYVVEAQDGHVYHLYEDGGRVLVPGRAVERDRARRAARSYRRRHPEAS